MEHIAGTRCARVIFPLFFSIFSEFVVDILETWGWLFFHPRFFSVTDVPGLTKQCATGHIEFS